ncbi:MAG: LysE family transporter [Prevotella sp.]|nr:LysE family transporter [Prevotella sp.]
MPFEFHINILDIIIKGMMIGIIASAPMGPVGVLCVQRTLNKGRWFGFVTGIGACISDLIYALITGYGMSFVMDFVNGSQTRFYLQLFGSILLFIFGLYCFRSDPSKKIHVSGNKGTLVHNGITAFLVTISNPLIIFLFMATFAQFAFIVPDHHFEMGIGYISIVFGAMIWWWGLTWLVEKVKGKFDADGIQLINRIIGSIVMIVSFVMLIGTLFNIAFDVPLSPINILN